MSRFLFVCSVTLVLCALSVVKQHADLKTALDTKEGFVPIEKKSTHNQRRN